MEMGNQNHLENSENQSEREKKTFRDIWNEGPQVSAGNFVYPILYLIASIAYLEIVIHLLIYHSIDNKIIYPILFAIPVGLFISFVTGLFKEKINRILFIIIMSIITLIYCIQYIYYYVFKVFFSFQSLGLAEDALSNFAKEVITAINTNAAGLVLLLLPMLLLIFLFREMIDFTRKAMKTQTVLLAAVAAFHVAAILTLLLFGKSSYTPYDLYYNSRVPDLCGKQLGITTMTRFDIARLFKKNENLELSDTLTLDAAPSSIPAAEASDTGKPTELDHNQSVASELEPTAIPVDTSPNMMDIDFKVLAAKEDDSTIRRLHEYFSETMPTNKNKYTGMFKGYNLILITAEGFSPYAVQKEKTPTLYQLVNEGFVFRNFYTALWQTSTSDGEYVALTGLVPTGTRSMYQGRDNLWPFSLGHQFNLIGVASKAFHNHTYTYYQRNETHPNLGYDFVGKGNGLELQNPDCWPASDLEMIDATTDKFIKDDQFHVYYLTVSGHMNYTFEGNSMSVKNRSLVADLPYSEDAKAYIACQIELDRALELLIQRLEEAGVADHTVIAMSADHYPYGWEKDKLDELAGHEIEPNFEIYKNQFILWCAGMEESIVIEKPCSSMDILPTLSNLFGIKYDSRLLMGRDILSDSTPLVFFSNRSFITDQVMYHSETGKVTYLTKDKVSDDYINNLNKIVNNKFAVSESILEKDYYHYVFPDYPKDFK